MARRRRKKTQEKKKKAPSPGSRKRKLITILLAVSAVLILIPIITFYQVFSWLQSDSFRTKLEEIVKDKGQSEKVAISSNLQIEDDQVKLQAIDLERVDLIQHAEARRIVAHIKRSELFNRVLDITKLTMEEAALQLDGSAIGNPLPPISKSDGGLLSKLAPKNFKLNAFECKDADIVLQTGEKRYSLTGSSISATPLTPNQSDEWQIIVENGRVHTPHTYLLTSNIKTATILRNKETTELSECRFMLTPGELRVKGTMQNATKDWLAIMRANKANVARLLSDDWKKRLTGEIYGDLKLIGTGTKITEAGGNISLQRGVLEALPILSDFNLTAAKSYRSIHLEKAECRISYPHANDLYGLKKAWLFDNIDLRSKDGNLRVMGHVLVGSEGELRGTLTVGLNDSLAGILSAINEDATSRIFNVEGEAGYQWLHINLSGTIDEPCEDLSARIQTVMAGSIKRAATQTVTKAARSTSSMFNTFVNRTQEMMDAVAEDDDEEPQVQEEATQEKERSVEEKFGDKADKKKTSVKNKKAQAKKSAAKKKDEKDDAGDAFEDAWKEKPTRKPKKKNRGSDVPGATDVLDLFF
ncbi:MAG: hypothetical protein Q4F35_07465 [Akkermansia sp.]|nr:hypothetical protein [Akkermansia sp.]